MKTVPEASVLTMAPAFALGLLCEPGRLFVTTGCAHYGHGSLITRFRESPGQPEVEPSTYSIAGSSPEHVNLNPSARSRETWQAAKSGDVLDGGQSLRCSPSTGEPCTWR
jgi:hypothetical protein